MLLRILKKFKSLFIKPRENYYFPASDNIHSKKALLSYILAPYSYSTKEKCPPKHANFHAAWEIVEILNSLGYSVTAVEASNKQFVISEDYDLLIGTLDCIDRFSPYLPKKCRKVFYALGVYVESRNGEAGELKRISALEERTGLNYIPKRLFPNPESIKRSVEKADHLIITGGQATIETFPSKYSSKSSICTMPIFPNSLGNFSVKHSSVNNEFIWFFGYGQVHKGLDLVIEAFTKMPNLTLNIAGTMEADFEIIYGKVISESENIKYHGYLQTDGCEFESLIKRCRAFVAPTVNEGISCACVSLIQLGLYPIMSEASGVDIESQNYEQLRSCTVPEIIDAVERVSRMGVDLLNERVTKNSEQAKDMFSPERFRSDFCKSIQKAAEYSALE